MVKQMFSVILAAALLALPLSTRAASADASLSALSLSGGSLSPSFSSDYTSYELLTEASTTTVKATPAAGGSAICRLAGTPISCSGIPLALGENSITVSVTAENGTTTRRYVILVSRQSATPTPAPTPKPSPTPKPTPSPTPKPSPTPSPSPSPTPSPSPSPVVTPTPLPTPSPSAPTPSASAPTTGVLLLATNTVTLGDLIEFKGSGFAPNSVAEVWLTAGGDTYLGPLSADASGLISGSVSLPAQTRVGPAVLSLTGSNAAGEQYLLKSELTISDRSSFGTLPLLIGGVVVVILLGALIGGLIVRRRARVTPPELPWQG